MRVRRRSYYPSPWNYLAGMSVAALLISLATSGQAQEQKFKAVSVKTPDGLTISAQDWGNPNGPEILFIHGFSQSHLSSIKQVTNSDLAKEFHIVTYDLRGHGNSEIPKPTDDFSLSLLVSDALVLLDLVGATNAHIVGNSAGGYVSQQLAIRYPERVKTLALFGSTPGLKHSHAPTWIPKIKEIGLKQFLADTIDERFDS